MDYIAGIDIGSASTKGIMIDIDSGNYFTSNRLHALKISSQGVSEDKSERFFEEVIAVLKEMMRIADISPNKLRTISISGFESVSFIGENGSEVRPMISYLDSRSEDISRDFGRKVGEDLIFEITKNRPSSIFEGYKLLWAFEDSEVKNRTRKVLDVAKYSVLRLTGNYVIDRSTAMLFAPFYNQIKSSWSDDIIDMAKLSSDIFPLIKESHDLSGTILKEVADKYGLSPETRVTVGTQDAYASLLADGVVSIGDSSFIYATSGVFDIIHDGEKFSNSFANTRHVLPGVYVAEAAMYNAGSLLNWFGGITGRKLKSLDKAASKSKRPGEIIALPFFSGERAPIWNNKIRGAFRGVSLEHGIADIYLSLLESIGFWLRYTLSIAEKSGLKVERIVAGGGGSKSSIWTQIVSDIIGRDQEIKISQGAAEGDLFISKKAEGLIKDYSELKKTVKTKKTIKYNSRLHDEYSHRYDCFTKFLEEEIARTVKVQQ